jgi:hypothetical protein
MPAGARVGGIGKMAKEVQPTARITDDRIRELFYEAVESFPAEYREVAERWLLEREIARIFCRAAKAEVLSALHQLPGRVH